MQPISKRILVAGTMLLACTLSLSAQRYDLDSLWRVGHDLNQPDTSRLEALVRYGTHAYLKRLPDSAVYFADLVLKESIEKDYPIEQARAYGLKGSAAFNKGEFRESIRLHTLALEIYKSLEYIKGIGSCYNNLGNAYLRLGEPTKAAKLYERALDMWISVGDKFSAATSLSNLGSIYLNYGNDARAIEAFMHALLIREELGDKPGIAAVHNNMGVLYSSQGDPQRALVHFKASLAIRQGINDVKGQASNMLGIGTVFVSVNRLDSALTYFSKALRLNREISALDNVAETQKNIAEVYERKQDLALAQSYCDSALINFTHTENAEGLAMVLNHLGGIQFKLHESAKAISSMKLSLEIAQSIQSVPNERDAAFQLYGAYKANGDYRKALEMHELYMVMRDSVENEENERSIIRSELQYEFEKDKLIKAQEKQVADRIAQDNAARRDRLQYSLISGFIIFLFLGMLVMGFLRIPSKLAFAVVFLALLVVFEFVLVLLDPYTDPITQGQPGFKFLINLGLALLITPVHSFLERFVQRRLLRLPVQGGGHAHKINPSEGPNLDKAE